MCDVLWRREGDPDLRERQEQPDADLEDSPGNAFISRCSRAHVCETVEKMETQTEAEVEGREEGARGVDEKAARNKTDSQHVLVCSKPGWALKHRLSSFGFSSLELIDGPAYLLFLLRQDQIT